MDIFFGTYFSFPAALLSLFCSGFFVCEFGLFLVLVFFLFFMVGIGPVVSQSLD